jgi:pimeloyl-ACP methyl ester carboxylesterase
MTARVAARACAPASGGGGSRRFAAALAAATAMLGLGSPAQAASPAPASLDLQPCRLDGLSTPALCGVLSRPLDAARPQDRRFDLHVAVVPAVARHKRADPVLFLPGGPGQSAIELAGPVAGLMSRLRNRRDLVLVDQRGTGSSLPLRCDGDEGPARDRSLADELDPGRRVAELAACRERLAARVGDLRAFTTPLAAADLEAVRQALGVPAWNVVGASYGTRLALELMRQAPGSVRRAVLDGVVPPDMSLPQVAAEDQQAALDAVWAGCEAEPACRRRHPDLAARWQALLATLPRTVTVEHPRTGRSETVRMTREALVGLVRPALYMPVLASGLPAAVTAASQGRWGPLFGLASAASGARGSAIASGQHFSVICSEDLGPASTPAASPRLDGSLDRWYTEVCADWPRADLPPGFRQVPPASAPVLLLSGGLDPVTPPRHADRMAQALGAQARSVVVPHAGHGTLGIACLRDVVFRFVDAPTAAEALEVETGCASAMPRPPAFRAPDGGGPAAGEGRP